MKASVKHDLLMVGAGAVIGAFAVFLLTKMYPTTSGYVPPIAYQPNVTTCKTCNSRYSL